MFVFVCFFNIVFLEKTQNIYFFVFAPAVILTRLGSPVGSRPSKMELKKKKLKKIKKIKIYKYIYI